MRAADRRKAYTELLYGVVGLILAALQWRLIAPRASEHVGALIGFIVVLFIAAIFLWSAAKLFRRN